MSCGVWSSPVYITAPTVGLVRHLRTHAKARSLRVTVRVHNGRAGALPQDSQRTVHIGHISR